MGSLFGKWPENVKISLEIQTFSERDFRFLRFRVSLHTNYVFLGFSDVEKTTFAVATSSVFSPKSPKSDAFESTGQTFSDRDFRNAKKQVFPLENSTFWAPEITSNPLASLKQKSMIAWPNVAKVMHLSRQGKRFLTAISGMRKSRFSHWKTQHFEHRKSHQIRSLVYSKNQWFPDQMSKKWCTWVDRANVFWPRFPECENISFPIGKLNILNSENDIKSGR